ncbi:MAG: hypothetical protein JSU65_13280 [Candidatus Zixiibacteriota bacterium]|nr:MAG: hypothetical protein JSU65_13280 [candidate division Zixibacteria bacterium]
MLNFRLVIVSVGISLIVPALCAGAVVVKQSPLLDSLDASFSLYSQQDEFGTFGEKASDSASSRNPGSSGRKSIVKAGLLSALVPGAGEYYLGNRKKARYFFAAEALTWISFVSFRTYGDWKKDDYIRFAADHANALLDGREDRFHDIVGFYDNIDQYNKDFLRAIENEPPLEDNPVNHWYWDSPESRKTYRAIKNSSREAYRRSEFVIGLAILSRIVSVVDAVRDARRMNRTVFAFDREPDSSPIRLTIQPFSSHNQVRLTLFTGF